MTDPKQDVQDVRAQFEAWAMRDFMYAPDDLIWQAARNCYADYSIHLAFNAYQAALQSPVVRELVEAAKVACEKYAGDWDGDHEMLNLQSALRTLGAGHVE